MGRLLSHDQLGNSLKVPGTENNKLKIEQMVSGPGFIITSVSSGTIIKYVKEDNDNASLHQIKQSKDHSLKHNPKKLTYSHEDCKLFALTSDNQVHALDLDILDAISSEDFSSIDPVALCCVDS